MAGVLLDGRIVEQMPVAWLAASLAIAVIIVPLISVAIVGVQLVNPFSDDTWELPARDSNPIYPGNPLLAIHFFGQMAIAMGIGHILGSLFGGIPAVIMGVGNLLGGCGLFLGLRFSIRLAKRKVLPNTENQQGLGR